MKRVIDSVKKIINHIVRPIERELPFFVFTFVLWALNSFIEIKTDIFRMNLAHIFDYIHYLAVAILFSFILTCIVHKLNNKWVKVCLYIVSLVIAFSVLALHKIFKTPITPHIMQLVAETNGSEATEFFYNYALSRGSIFALAIILIIVCAIALWERLYHRKRDNRYGKYARCFFFIIVLISLSGVGILLKLYSCSNFAQMERFIIDENDHGMDNMTAILYSIHSLHIAANESQAVVETTLNEIEHGASRCTSNDTLNLVVVIGESYNKRHAGIYGYDLNTTPRLQKELERGNLIVFNDVISPYNTTSRTLKYVMNAGGLQQEHGMPLTVAVFKRAGYDIAWWNNQFEAKNQKNIFSFALNNLLFNPKIKDKCYSFCNETCFQFDGELIDNFINTGIINRFPNNRRLITFHLMGQHVMAKKRYPADNIHSHFTPDSVTNHAQYIDDPARIDIAHYDNATLYNDEVLGRIIDLFSNENTVIIYFSDHGEEVYDYRYELGRSHSENKDANFLHGQNDIPFMVWFSDKYAQSHSDVISRLKMAMDRPFMNTDLPQILFDLGEITTPYRQEKSNPISDSFTPRVRIVYDTIDYDSITKSK